MMMMKTIKTILISLLAVLITSCTGDNDAADNTPTNPERIMTITVGMNTDNTNSRVAYDDTKIGAGPGSLTWEANDSIIVVGFDADGTYQGQSVFKIQSGAGHTSATFSGKGIANTTKYNVYYKSKALEISQTDGTPTYKAISQTQSADNNADHIKDNLYLSATDVTNLSKMTLTMRNSIMKFVLSNIPANVGALKELLWEDETAAGTNSMALSFADNAVTFDATKSTLTAYIAFMPEDMNVATLSLTTTAATTGKFSVTLIGDNDYIAQKELGTKTYNAGARYSAPRDVWTVLGEPVDLGLPSGTKWASYNIGASQPEDYGYYYAWGETEAKTTYSPSTYKFYDYKNSAYYISLGKDIQGTAYDVATAKWGSKWMMPTQAQLQELLNNCTWTWDATKKGYTITSKSNSNSIFMPAAGRYYNGKTGQTGIMLIYWSTMTNGVSTSRAAYYLQATSTAKRIPNIGRDEAFPCRPVTK